MSMPVAGPGAIRAGAAGLPAEVDLVVAGLGATGAGVALDAAARGLRVLAVDVHDVAFGTSRWSSKLAHGGLRYLASGQVGIAHESAVERDVLMRRTAPHLVHPLPMLTPLTEALPPPAARVTRLGLLAGDVLRRAAATPAEVLPRSRRLGVTETLALASCVRREGLRGGLLGWDGQLEDDARLVVALARTAAAYGATVRTRLRVTRATGTQVWLTDTAGGRHPVRCRGVVNATGVWAAGLAPDIALRPSRGTHLVLRADRLPGTRCAVLAPVPGTGSRFVFALPQPDGRWYVGLTDEPVDDLPDVPVAPQEDVDLLLRAINGALATGLSRGDVAGAFAGLRPLLRAEGRTADLSRRHAVRTTDGVTTVVGGKLTTYRRMAQDAVDAAVAAAGLDAGPCRTRDLPLVGAVGRERLARLPGPRRLVRRYGAEAEAVLAHARELTGLSEAELLDESRGTSLAELVFGVTHEGAADVADLLDRRTRVGLVPADRAAAVPLAERALRLSLEPRRAQP